MNNFNQNEINQIINLYSKFQLVKSENEFGIEDKYLFGLAEALVFTIDDYKDLKESLVNKLSEREFVKELVNLIADTISFAEDYEYSAFNPAKSILKGDLDNIN